MTGATWTFSCCPIFVNAHFPDAEGRPRPEVVVDTDSDAIYDFEAGQDHIDLALRYSHYIGEWEFGLSYFSGIDRLPSNFVPVAFAPNGQPSAVVPVYSLINQAGIDGQVFFGDWTWKLEAINKEYRSGVRKGSHTFQSVVGFEYTWVGFTGGASDLGFVVEYHYSDANTRETIFDNDLATALRFVLNDAQSTEVLMGFLTDADTQPRPDSSRRAEEWDRTGCSRPSYAPITAPKRTGRCSASASTISSRSTSPITSRIAYFSGDFP